MIRVLVLDDDLDVCTTVTQILTAEGYVVDTAATRDEALSRVDHAPPDVILIDVRLTQTWDQRAADGAHGAGGISFAEMYRQRPGPHAALVLFTALPDSHSLAERIGASAVLPKPFHLPQLLDVVARCAVGRVPQAG